MFRPTESYDMEDPFRPRPRHRLTVEEQANMVATFTLSQPKSPEQPVSRREAARAFHRSACQASVVGTVFEQSTKVWKRNCTFEVICTLRVSIHGSITNVVLFMNLMESSQPQLHGRMQRGYKLRSIAEMGGKPGDILLPRKSLRASRFGKRPAAEVKK